MPRSGSFILGIKWKSQGLNIKLNAVGSTQNPTGASLVSHDAGETNA